MELFVLPHSFLVLANVLGNVVVGNTFTFVVDARNFNV